MSWFRPASATLARQLSRALDPRSDYEPQACYNSFCKHWQQAHDIIAKSHPSHLHDDVLGVVNHLEQMATLLVFEARARELNNTGHPAACLEHLLTENLPDKLYEWAICTGKYENAVRLEQLKLFGILISHYNTQVIAAEPFLRPLLKLLSGFRNELPPPNVENRLVVVLKQLCVSLMQNITFIDLFFLTTHAQSGSHAEFIIVRLLLTSVHREGSCGAAARDALLLCANMSARCPPLAQYMLAGNTCPVLATGLSGLYSLLPRTLPEKTHRLLPDDVNHINKLTLFIDSLEFCNATAQVAHTSIKKHLLDLLYQGFLVPVMGPALLQSGASEQASATAYLELILRCVTERGLLRTVLHFLFVYEYDGVRVIDVLLKRLDGDSQLSHVTLALMETLINLNCEDVMIELVFKYLLTGQHLTPSYRHKITDSELYREAAVSFLSLSPNCCARPIEKTRQWVEELAASGRKVLDFKRDDDGRVNGVNDDIAMSNLVQDAKFNYGNPNETLFGNYHAYLCDARFEIVSRTIASANWSCKYDSVIVKRETNNNRDIKDDVTKAPDSLISVCTSEYDTLKTSDTSEKEAHSLTSLNEMKECSVREHDSLISIGDSDCESYGDDDDFAEDVFRKKLAKVEDIREYEEVTRTWRRNAENVIGPLLTNVLRKAASFLEADVSVNSRLTAVVCRLCSWPAPLLASLLLWPGWLLQPGVPSLYQILSKLKEEVDELTEQLDNVNELVDKARVFLLRRESDRVTARGHTDGQNHSGESPHRMEGDFRRVEPKRRSISSSLSHMLFSKRNSSSPSQSHSPQNSPTPQKRPIFTEESYWGQSITLRTILNAVLLDEWLKELAALCEEQALRLSADYYEDDSYIKTVVL